MLRLVVLAGTSPTRNRGPPRVAPRIPPPLGTSDQVQVLVPSLTAPSPPLPPGIFVASTASLDSLSTSIPIVRIAASAAEADPANNVIAPVPGDRESCLAYISGGESMLPPSYDVDRGIDTFGTGYYKRLGRTLTHLKAMVAAYRLNQPAVLILDENENPVRHPDFGIWSDASKDALAEYAASLETTNPGWRHVQLSVLALSDAFGGLVLDWADTGKKPATPLTPEIKSRQNSELWSYGAYLVSKQGLASTLLTFADHSAAASSTGTPKTLKFDLSKATCVEPDNCVLWEGVQQSGWLVATPPLFAPGRQAAVDEADASDVEVAVSELVKENMYHVTRWWKNADELVADAKQGSLRLPSDEALDEMMRLGGVDPLDKRHVDLETTKTVVAPEVMTARTVTPTVKPEVSYEKPESSSSDVAFVDDMFEDAATAVGSEETETVPLSQRSSKSSKKSGKHSKPEHSSRVAPISARGALVSDVPIESYPQTNEQTVTPVEKKTPAGPHVISAAEAAAQVAAGITRTESAFEYGEKIFDQTWGNTAYAASVGAGSVPEATNGDVLGLLTQYMDEPRLGRAPQTVSDAIGFVRLGDAEVAEVRKHSNSLRASVIAGLGVAAVGVAAVAMRRRPEAEQAMERAALIGCEAV